MKIQKENMHKYLNEIELHYAWYKLHEISNSHNFSKLENRKKYVYVKIVSIHKPKQQWIWFMFVNFGLDSILLV